nr:hypothetical protein CFP56_64843 [Quercus suber]
MATATVTATVAGLLGEPLAILSPQHNSFGGKGFLLAWRWARRADFGGLAGEIGKFCRFGTDLLKDLRKRSRTIGAVLEWEGREKAKLGDVHMIRVQMAPEQKGNLNLRCPSCFISVWSPVGSRGEKKREVRWSYSPSAHEPRRENRFTTCHPP